MESDDDFQFLQAPMASSSPVLRRKLKRLKKASDVSEDFLTIEEQSNESSPFPELNTSEFEAEGNDQLSSRDFDESDKLRRLELGPKVLDEGDEMDQSSLGLDGAGNVSRVKRTLEFDSVSEIDEQDDDLSPGIEEEANDPLIDEPEKKRQSSDAFEEDDVKKRNSKKKKLKSSGDGGSSKETAASGRILEKERKKYVEQLRSESQRLLRETRGAAFRPIPLVQKPISSVLEKMRQRKLELSRKSIKIENSIIDDNEGDTLLTEVLMKHTSDAKGREDTLDKACEDKNQRSGDVESQKRDSMCVDGCTIGTNLAGCEIMPSEKPADEITEAFRAPIHDTEELFSDSQTSINDDMPNETSSSRLQEKFTPSILAMNLKLDSSNLDDITSNSLRQEKFTPSILAMNLELDSAALDDVSSDEEDYDKENVDPRPHGLSNSPSLPNGDPVKAFLDDEAEEEDDSDHDLRFGDDEEDEDTDLEELHDMIATGYEDNPLDSERRNELHQKWLEQQDASGTENLLQKLKYGSKIRKPNLLEDENNEGETDDSEYGDATGDDMLPLNLNVARMNIRKVKQMLPHVFTDKDDQYMSDDEETDKILTKQRVLSKAEGESTFLSPAEDGSSREVFGLIKKLNVVPDVKKRQRAPSFLDTPLTGESKNTSSKSSFLGRGSNLSITSSRKQGSSNSRSFIFGRDDSNSRSAITTEEPSDPGQNENKSTRIATAKFSYSQVKSSTQNTASETKSGTSLFDILRQSSIQLQPKQYTLDDESSHCKSVFMTFKLEKTHLKKPIKTEGRF